MSLKASGSLWEPLGPLGASESLWEPLGSTRWMQGDGGSVDTNTIIFTNPCHVVLHFTSELCLMGFYHSHDKHKPRKRTKEFRPDSLRNLVVACTPETIPLYPADCVCIEVVKLTSLIGVESPYKVRLFAKSNDDLIRIVQDLGGSEGNRTWRMYWGGT